PEQLEQVAQRLASMGLSGPLDGIYYLPVALDLLTDEQRQHHGECGPYIFVLEAAGETSLKLELLVRAQGKLRCSCVAYATPAQRDFIMDYMDNFLREMEITI
ncbi:MAG: hypothetical protein Q8S17_08800, partial [Humidesulfovibrio sp.]|nr:hypothetical protein [Humidesulfovibrio sp.]